LFRLITRQKLFAAAILKLLGYVIFFNVCTGVHL
jgi:hypothetical protein